MELHKKMNLVNLVKIVPPEQKHPHLKMNVYVLSVLYL